MTTNAALLNSALALVFLFAFPNDSKPKRADARNDGLFGPVESVPASLPTTGGEQDVNWQQAIGQPIALPIFWRECEYGAAGNRVKSGQIIGGEWRGEVTRLVRDGNGIVAEEIFENANGEINHREIYGPKGRPPIFSSES